MGLRAPHLAAMASRPRMNMDSPLRAPRRQRGHGLDLTITIVFQGTFGARGYRLGRLAATLFRLPDESGENALKPPTPVGYCPSELQALNTADSFGRMVIVHSPKHIPVRPGGFQVVIGATINRPRAKTDT